MCRGHGRLLPRTARSAHLNYAKFVEEGETQISITEDYNSHNTQRLDVAGMQQLLRKLDFIRAIERGEHATPEE